MGFGSYNLASPSCVALLMDKDELGITMKACVILYNMIIEDEYA